MPLGYLLLTVAKPVVSDKGVKPSRSFLVLQSSCTWTCLTFTIRSRVVCCRASWLSKVRTNLRFCRIIFSRSMDFFTDSHDKNSLRPHINWSSCYQETSLLFSHSPMNLWRGHISTSLAVGVTQESNINWSNSYIPGYPSNIFKTIVGGLDLILLYLHHPRSAQPNASIKPISAPCRWTLLLNASPRHLILFSPPRRQWSMEYILGCMIQSVTIKSSGGAKLLSSN